MIAAVDVNYLDEAMAVAAAVIINDFADTVPLAQYSTRVTEFGEYVPGKFYQRELPCIVAVLDKVIENLHVIIIDGFVMLGDGPGLGYHLWQHLGRQAAIIGVAKSPFPGATPITIYRGQSRRPLYITALGMDPEIAAENIIRMAGSNRIPDLLRQADRLAKEILREKTG